MPNYTPTPLTSLSNQTAAVSAINDNLDDIAEALASKLGRDAALPNQMEADIDLNGNDLINVGEIRFGNGESIGGRVFSRFWEFTGDGTQKEFVIAGATVEDKLFYDVAINGVVLNPDEDYDVIVGANPANSIMKFTNAIPNLTKGWAILRASGTASIFVAQEQTPVYTIAGTSATIDASYKQGHILCTSALPVTLTLRANNGNATLDWKSGDYFSIVQKGAGQVTVSPAVGVTIAIPTGLAAKTRTQYSVISFVCENPSTNTWTIANDMAGAI